MIGFQCEGSGHLLLAFFLARKVFIACAFCSFVAQVFVVSFNVSLFCVAVQRRGNGDGCDNGGQERGRDEGRREEGGGEREDRRCRERQGGEERRESRRGKESEGLSECCYISSIVVSKESAVFSGLLCQCVFDIRILSLAVRSVGDYDANMQDSLEETLSLSLNLCGFFTYLYNVL